MDSKLSLYEVIKQLEISNKNPSALNELVDNQWISTSTDDMLQQIKEIALGLNAIGIKRGQMISILAFPSPTWTIVDFAIMAAGAISVPIFPNISEENLIFQIDQSEARTLFLGNGIPSNLYESHKNLFNRVICINSTCSEKNSMSLNDLKSLGREHAIKNPNRYQELMEQMRPEDVATIIYTSGSTGVPKGAEITQKAACSMLSFDGFSWDSEKDKYLSILPLAHVFGRMLNICLVAWGVSVYYLNDVKQIAAVCQEIHPTIIVVVPRLLEKVYAKMVAKVEQAGFLKRTIGHWAFDLANDEDDDSLYKQMLHPIADKVVYSALREVFGGQLRLMISGGAALDPHLSHFYIDVGLPVYEGWGLTEAATVCCNRPGKRKIGTVGLPLDGMEIKIGDEGEVLVKGPNVLKGYYKNPEATQNTFNSEGWLRTGDKGTIDEDGYLTLIGRLKEMLKTSTGEYVVPIPIEQEIAKAGLVDIAVVVADKRKYTTCILFPDFEVLHKLKESQGLSHVSDEEFLNSKKIRKEMLKVIDQVNAHHSKAEKILDFRFIPTPPTIENGDLTPSMKIRREAVENKYAEIINSMYPKDAI